MWHNSKRITALEGQVSSLKEKLHQAKLLDADHNEVYKALQEKYDSDVIQMSKTYENLNKTMKQKCEELTIQRDSANVLIGNLKNQRLNDIGFQLTTIKWLIGSVVLNVILLVVVTI